MISLEVNAHDFEAKNADGVAIYYNIISSSDLTCSVTYRGSKFNSYNNEYTGSVVIPSSVDYNGKNYRVSSIGYSAFYDCTGLTSLEIPNSVTSIGDYAINGCTSLTTLNIPNTVTHIGYAALSRSGFTTPVFNKHCFALMPEDYSGEYKIPEGIKEIAGCAFYGCENMTAVTIPESVSSLGGAAFQNCTNLETVYYNAIDCDCSDVLHNTYVFSKDYAIFLNCNNLKNLIIGETVEKIPAYSFCYISSLASVKMSQSVKSIGNDAFYNCSSLKSVEIPSTVSSIGSSAFSGCRSLCSVEIPTSITKIYGNTFAGCSKLSSVNIPNSVKVIGASAFAGTILESVEIPNSVTEIGAKAFRGCYFTSVKIPNSVTEIGNAAFENCYLLNAVELPNSITKIEDYTFNGCEMLSMVEIPNSVNFIGKSAFCNCRLILINIPSSVTSIGENGFYCCYNLKTVIIGSGVTEVKSSAFAGCKSLRKLILLPNTMPTGLYNALSDIPSEGRMTFVANDSYNGYEYRLGTIKKYDYLSSWFEVDSVLYVPVSPSERTCAAIDCTKNYDTKEVVIGETVNYKGVGMKAVEINPYFLYKYSNVEKVKLPESVKEIGDYAFYDCRSLTDFNLPNSLQTIGKNAFYNMPIKSIVIPAATTDIGDGAFNGCAKLEKLEAKDGKDSLRLGYNARNYWYGDNGKGMFYDCPLKEVVIGRNLVYETGIEFGYSPFYRNTALEKVTLTDIPTEVFTNEFYGCTSLKNVSLGDRVKKIGDYAFSGCSALDYFAFGASVESIGDEAFSDCTNLTKLYAEPATPPACGTQALDDINKWNCTLYVPEASIASYQKADQWKEFFFMEAGEFTNAIKSTAAGASNAGKTYNLQGIEVGDSYRGVVIKGGKKMLLR